MSTGVAILLVGGLGVGVLLLSKNSSRKQQFNPYSGRPIAPVPGKGMSGSSLGGILVGLGSLSSGIASIVDAAGKKKKDD